MQSEQEIFLKNGNKQMRQANMPQIKPRLWASIMLDKCDMIANLFQIFDQLIDPRLIFFDQDLTKQQSDIFFNAQALFPLFSRLEKSDPQICLYVTIKYGAKDIPGQFSGIIIFYNLFRFHIILIFKKQNNNLEYIKNRQNRKEKNMNRN
ncbi:unnamed protein product [Paramecium pentaurelia]|uniref:Uncharacterized protein n=1 Tax=Paramecium pentaurelia TaxID=43138 RepID=A0A8S1UQB4_9CILI|nr:unnamed protein product [Paramecium pentaurelia]